MFIITIVYCASDVILKISEEFLRGLNVQFVVLVHIENK